VFLLLANRAGGRDPVANQLTPIPALPQPYVGVSIVPQPRRRSGQEARSALRLSFAPRCTYSPLR